MALVLGLPFLVILPASMPLKNPVSVMQVCTDVRYLLIEIYFHCPTFKDTHTILSKVTITPLLFTILIFR
jgi:hypothetical protein